MSVTAVLLGLAGAFALYRGRDTDPLDIPLLRNRFYVDDFYDKVLVPYFQNALAAVIHFFDELIINGLFVG